MTSGDENCDLTPLPRALLFSLTLALPPIPSFYASCSAPYLFGARPQLRSFLDASDPFTEELFEEDTCFLSLLYLWMVYPQTRGLRWEPFKSKKEEPERLFVPLKMITATWLMGRLASRLSHFQNILGQIRSCNVNSNFQFERVLTEDQ